MKLNQTLYYEGMILLSKYQTQQSKVIIELLKQRIEQNYADFKAEILSLDEENIFDNARIIAVVTDTYEQLLVGGFSTLTDDEAIFMLQFHNPLELVADFLSKRVIEEDVDDALEEVINTEGLEDCYLTTSFVDELRERYGMDANIKIALLEETISAGLHYVRLMQMADNATGNITMNFDTFFDFEDDKEGCF